MRRLCLLLALLFLLPPIPASASERAPEREQYVGAGPGGPQHVARAEGGMELLLRLERSQADAAQGLPHGPGASPHPFRIAAVLRLPGARGSAPGPFVPHCQRLPYQATAPPLR